jgi:putative CocE/NonD family hydrolase
MIFNYHIPGIAKTRRVLLLTIYILVSGNCFTNYASAQNLTDETFKIPSQLAELTLSNNDQIKALLASDSFINELKKMAWGLSSDTMARQSMFNKTALLSLRGEHSKLLQEIENDSNPLSHYHYTLHTQTLVALDKNQLKNTSNFEQTLNKELQTRYSALSDEGLFKISSALAWSVSQAEDYLLNIYKKYQIEKLLTTDQVIEILVNTQLLQVISKVIPVSEAITDIENERRYQIEPEVLITTAEGIELTATIVRKKADTQARPAAFQFTIYADEAAHIKTAIHAAAHGYIGIIANSRGKRASSDKIIPWEHEGKDATAVIDWITKQSWNDGRVAMYGGSYNGFTQWAAAKYMHPALKTIVPYAAASPITGLPIENNIFLTANYAWAFYVTNNNTTDNSVYADWQKSNQLIDTLFKSGRAFQDIDKIDGKANPWFQKWLKHPSYDTYYQGMLPYEEEFAKINIPVLSITGYFDGGQISAIDFLKNHYKFNKNADHSLLIGPYDHFTAQGLPRSHHSNYKLDEVALAKDTEEITFAWFDHVLYGKAKPELVKNRVNYQLMGSNTWQHHSSYETLNKQAKTFYLSNSKNKNGHYVLLDKQESQLNATAQTVDMSDRTTEHNAPQWTVIQEQLNEANGLIFSTEPMIQAQQLAGAITGNLSISVNKKDVDIGFNFYELMADGKVFHLSHYQSRASYANDMSVRQLLTPNKKTTIPIVNGRMTAKLINKGSRLVIVLNVNKNANTQVNMGSGKDVSTETLADAGQPLTLKWFNDSQINIPLQAWQG